MRGFVTIAFILFVPFFTFIGQIAVGATYGGFLAGYYLNEKKPNGT
jgi:hypothetical protein